MSNIRQRLLPYKYLFAVTHSAFRVFIFENFGSIYFFVYLAFILSCAIVFSVIHWSLALLVLLIGALLYSKSQRFFYKLKPFLIYRGDLIEYIKPTDNLHESDFIEAKVILNMHLDEVKKSKMYPLDLIKQSERFYLVEVEGNATIISYDWIVSLLPSLFEEDTVLQ